MAASRTLRVQALFPRLVSRCSRKARDLVYGELFDRESAGIAFVARRKSEQQLKAVAVTVKRMRTRGPLPWEVIGKEAVE